ncbi:acyl-homoserine-lactone synthase [Rhizobium sp. SSA_523]|uniref:acyl-homoserine-lactone synthase n=1 Tax=Rhizobium sp. SSA_523 TaxID=2952477 RepID=UPI002091DEC8|nr:acyl-homoserine-lactone synthase [Rhizobium sp. SSA_523]MCO5732173.1 hypothetical protein [Rhizobium sp. SSA_523]WKC21412.1 acyl-homoserine-lactone synthase [Rhizobium sp. SSA_523]
MIYTIDGSNRQQHHALLDAMYRLRAQVFRDRLQWEVTVENGRERDVFDDADPLYLLSCDETSGRLQGAVRLLATTGPNMLRDVFPVLLPDKRVVESATIWESSRFCINPSLHADANGTVNRVTSELLCGLVEVGLRLGLHAIVSVYDARMARIFRAADCPAHVIGPAQRIGGVMTYAGLFDISPAMRERIARRGGIERPAVLKEPAFLPPRRAAAKG